MPNALVPLASFTLASPQEKILFSAIPTTGFRDLILTGANIGLASPQQLIIRVNGDAANNYSRTYAAGNGSTKASATDASASGVVITNSAFTANGQFKADLIDYSATDKQKTFLVRYNNAVTETVMTAGKWSGTAAITSIELLAFVVNFAAGSRFDLYGVL